VNGSGGWQLSVGAGESWLAYHRCVTMVLPRAEGLENARAVY